MNLPPKKFIDMNTVELTLDKYCRFIIPIHMRNNNSINDYYAYRAEGNTIYYKRTNKLQLKKDFRFSVPIHLVKALDFKPFDKVILRRLDNDEYSITKEGEGNEQSEE